MARINCKTHGKNRECTVKEHGKNRTFTLHPRKRTNRKTAHLRKWQFTQADARNCANKDAEVRGRCMANRAAERAA